MRYFYPFDAALAPPSLFSSSNIDLLAICRHLSIFLDPELFEAFKFWGFVRRRAGPPGGASPYDAVAHILSHTTALNTLRIQLAHLTGPQSAWSPLFHESPFAIPLSDALSRSNIPFTLPNLHTLELDGFSNIDRLLKVSPELEILRLRLSGGFSDLANAELVRAVGYVSGLQELTYTPGTLRLEKERTPVALANGHWNFQQDAEDADEEDGLALSNEEMCARVELVQELGLKLPTLKSLNLETKSYGSDVSFTTPQEILPSIVSLSPFPIEIYWTYQLIRHSYLGTYGCTRQF